MKKVYNPLLSLFLILILFSCDKNKETDKSEDGFTITDPGEKAKSEWIVNVHEFIPAPGQFQNKTSMSLLEEAKNVIGDNHQFISLGNFGGYVIFDFGGYLENGTGYDIAIYGNPFENSSEPGIVMVSFDENQNGIPDDKWYELKGSEYDKPETIKNYEITYFKPKQNEDPYKVRYTDNRGIINGILDYDEIKPFHSNAMYPSELGDSYKLKGTLLKNNVVYEYDSKIGSDIYKNLYYDWGYADNRGYENTGDLRGADLFDFDNAIDENGNPVKLDKIHFIKVYNATLSMDKSETTNFLGDRSCEIVKAKRLH